MKDREGFIFKMCVFLGLIVIILGAVVIDGCSISSVDVCKEVSHGL